MSGAHKSSVCFVIPRYVTFSTGGAEIQVHYLVNEFLNRGWEVELLCGGKGHKAKINESPYFDKRIKYHHYGFRSVRFLEFFSVFYLLFKSKSEFYYQRTDFALTGACALYCKLKKRKMIYALAQDKDAAKGKYLNEFKTYHYKSVFKKLIRWIDFALIDSMVEWGKSKSIWVIAQSEKQKHLFEKSFHKPCKVITSSFPINDEPQIEKENILLWVGNMHPIKRPELFIQLIQKLGVSGDWKFVMIGKVSEAIKHMDTSGIDIKGELSYKETLHWFDKAKVLVNTSSEEGMPNTFIQAWMKKVLVLSLKVDPDQLLEYGKLGYTFNDDVEQLKDFLQNYISNTDLYKPICDAASHYAVETFNVKKNVEQLINLITEK